MLRNLNNKRAQSVRGAYALVIFMVLGVITAMTVYFKRAVQARHYDALHYMVNDVRQRTAGIYNGELYLHYEPYYTNTVAIVERSASSTTRVLPGATSGIYQKVIDESTSARVNSETAPPRDFDLTTPTGS